VIAAFVPVLLLLAVSDSSVHPAVPEADVDSISAVPAIATFLAPFLLPKVAADVCQLRSYVQEEEYLRLRRQRGDLAGVDAIYRRALRLSWNSTSAALLVSLLATMDHRRVGVRLPVAGMVVWFPLTSEFPAEFNARVGALPAQLYPDSPPGGDRDKLQHFFGSALVAAVTESREAAERAGDFVEWGEDRFILGGVLDPRDLRANAQGASFGLALLENPAALPSAYFGDGSPVRTRGGLSIDERERP
jgi:hypothetical protein